MDKFQNKYRIASTRLASWDYAHNAAYFITICTEQMKCDFGRLVKGEMSFSILGQAAVDCWAAIPDHFPFVELGEFVVMPNHVHGILEIRKSDPVETQYLASLHPVKRNRFGPQSQNLASIIRGYKIGVTKFARSHHIPFAWQERYYDHVIRNLDEHERIRQYVLINVQKWQEDKYYIVP